MQNWGLVSHPSIRGGARDRTNNPVISGQPALAPEPVPLPAGNGSKITKSLNILCKKSQFTKVMRVRRERKGERLRDKQSVRP